MTGFVNDQARKFYAETYDTVMGDWTGEIEFYQDLAKRYVNPDQAILELACGTGRISLRLAEQGHRVVGVDISPDMIRIVREKNLGLSQTKWIEADMRNFQLEERFPLIIIPAHSFQNLTSVEDHISALETIHKHLLPDGRLVIHVDHLEIGWLAGLIGEGGQFEDGGSFTHPETGREIQRKYAWSYEHFTQTASLDTVWNVIGDDGSILEVVECGRLSFHCFFPVEMEHLLVRCGYKIEDLYGDFSLGDLTPDSSEMVWVAKKRE